MGYHLNKGAIAQLTMLRATKLIIIIQMTLAIFLEFNFILNL